MALHSSLKVSLPRQTRAGSRPRDSLRKSNPTTDSLPRSSFYSTNLIVAQVESVLFNLYASVKQVGLNPTHQRVHPHLSWLPLPRIFHRLKYSEALRSLTWSSLTCRRQLSSPLSTPAVHLQVDPYAGTLFLRRIHSGVLHPRNLVWALLTLSWKRQEMKKILRRNSLERVERPVAGPREVIRRGVNITLVHPERWGEGGPKPVLVSALLPIPISAIFDLFPSPQSMPIDSPYHFTPSAAKRISACGSLRL